MPSSNPAPALILASGSRYRRELLCRLTPEFECLAPDIDESRRPGERPEALARRLAEEKAAAIARLHPGALVIGSDQVAALGDETLGKPGTAERAIAQLERFSGKAVEFYTAVHVLRGSKGYAATHVDRTTVHFRTLEHSEIEAYVAAESPLDCAGSFKSEGLGVALMTAIENRDPTALIGLPLIALAELLRGAGYPVLR